MNDQTPDSPVTLLHARSSAETAVITALLRSEGIPFYVDGRLLVDEFAISQGLLGLKSEISVRSHDLLRAQALLAEARESARDLERDVAEGNESDDGDEAAAPR